VTTSDAFDDVNVTVSESFGLTTLPSVAVISVVPTATPVASPVAAPIEANAIADDFQVTLVVMFFVELSLYVPVAVNCTVFPMPTLGDGGVTAMDCSVAAVALTVSGSFGLTMLPCVAVICVVPAATPVASPVAAPIVANAVFDDFQVTLVVMFFVELSLYVPVAVNCCVLPETIEGDAGVTTIDLSVTPAAVTISASFGLTTLPCVAVICVVPAATPVASPVAAPIVANAVFDDFHVTLAVVFFVELSLYVPVAVNCCVAPAAMEGVAGVTAIDCSVAAGPTVSVAAPLVILPTEFVTTTSNFAPLSALVVAGVV
jgi:hypothetical protein